MAVTALQLKAVVSADTKDAEEGMKRVKKGADEAAGTKGGEGGLGGLIKRGMEVAGIFAAFELAKSGVELLVDQVKDSITAANRYQLVQAQTVAVLKSTHDASGQTAESVQALAEHYAQLTLFSRDSTQQAENMLLTFTNLKGNVFPQATQATLDFATAMHMDATQAALDLGKALNDPATGMTKLQREGVTFDEKQKELIKTYEKHGQLAKAQAIILAELTKEFGGSAQAAGTTFAGKLAILNNQLEDTKEKVGAALIPVLTQLLGALTPVFGVISGALAGALNWLSGFITGTLLPTFQRFMPVFQALSYYGQTLVQVILNGLKPALDRIGDSFKQTGTHGLNVNDIIKGMAHIFSEVFPYIFQAAQAFGTLATFIGTKVIPVVIQLVGWFVTSILPILRTLVDVVLHNVVPALMQVWTSITASLLPALEKLWGNLSPILMPVLRLLGWVLQTIVGPALSLVITIIGWLIDKIADVIGWLGHIGDAFSGLGRVASAIWGGIQTAFKAGINTIIGDINGFIRFLDAIQIHIPAIGVGPVKTPGFDWNGLGLAQIPYLAEGGDVKRGGLAVLGDKGPELVGLPGGAQVTPLTGGGVGPQTIIVQLVADGRKLAEVTVPHIHTIIRNASGRREF